MTGYIRIKPLMAYLEKVYNSDAGGAFAFNPVLKYIIDDLKEGYEDKETHLEYHNLSNLRREFWSTAIYGDLGHYNWEKYHLDIVSDRKFVEKLAKFYIDGGFFAVGYEQMRKELDETAYAIAPNSSNQQVEKQYITMVADVLGMIEEHTNLYCKYYTRDLEEIDKLDY